MQIIEKKIGETPLDALKRFRDENPAYKDERLSYAGRLDPMASGKLLLLEGEENDRRNDFLNLDKRYQFEILFGISTDTYDLLGLVTQVSDHDVDLEVRELQALCSNFIGRQSMPYPPYSSMTVEHNEKQVPLWQLARNGDLPDVLPKKEVEVYDLVIDNVRTADGDCINKYIRKHIKEVKGDFRQQEIMKRWQEVFEASKKINFQIAKAEVSSSSGLYVRRLVKQIGERIDVPATTFSIHRSRIGIY